MTLTKSAIYLIGRLHPEIFELLGNPYGPYAFHDRVSAVALNPQPLPPSPRTAVNPQPLPPKALPVGIAAAGELVRAVVIADRTGGRIALELDDWCGTPPKRPPFTWPPLPWPLRGEIDWGEYNLGLAVGLELSAGLWEGAGAAETLGAIHDTALEVAAKGASARAL